MSKQKGEIGLTVAFFLIVASLVTTVAVNTISSFNPQKRAAATGATVLANSTPTPSPKCATSSWKTACGFAGKVWCLPGSSCNIGWVLGPSASASCPPAYLIINTGTYCTRWDSWKSFNGFTSQCTGDAFCLTATKTPTPIATRTPTPTVTPSKKLTATPTRTPTMTPKNIPTNMTGTW